MAAQTSSLLELLQPLIDAYDRGDTEHAGMEVAATLRLFAETSEVRLDWRDAGGVVQALDV